MPILLLWLWATSTFAQGRYQAGLLPSVNVNTQLPQQWSLNTKLESRQLLASGTFGDAQPTEYRYVLTDLSTMGARKVGLNSRIAAGYLIRFRGPQISHRFIQQYSMVQRLPYFRLGHRLVTDQTLVPNQKPEYRLRYRLATELPLNGQSADPKEFYLKLSNEYLNSLEDTRYDLEIRLATLLGYTVSEHHKLELGIDYRLGSLVQSVARHSYWTSLNWYIDL